MYHQILQILADGCQYTTEQLIKQLTLSAIELEQKTLMAYGIRLHSPTANTYQLAEPVELLDRTTILSALPVVTRQRLKRLEIHSVLDSTNHYALTQYFDAVPYACLAENIALAVTVVRVLLMLGATDIGIKWPNDILWQGRKVAGLLLESRCGNGCDIVYGIGINVKLFDTKTINQPWIDLYTILEHSSISRNTLAAKLIDQCLQTLLIYPQVGLTAFRDDWYHFDLSYGQRVTLEIPLRLKKRDLNSIYVYGEVSLRL